MAQADSSQPRQISVGAGPDINRTSGRFTTDRRSNLNLEGQEPGCAPLRKGNSPPDDHTGSYLQLGWPLFPVNPRTRAPLIKDGGGFYAATADETTIAGWLQRWPRALLATPTGRSYGHIAVDVDIKHPPISGFDALAELGWAILPNTPIVHSPSGGLHLHLDPGEREIPTTLGRVGAGIDVRGEISSIILPTPGGAYRWDPVWNLNTVGLAPAPDWLIPPASDPKASAEVPAKLEDAYAAAALADACRRIRSAPAGQQETTLNTECFSIGTLAGAGGIPADIALNWLLKAAHDMPDYDERRRWRSREIERKVLHSFADGLRRPREVRHG
jgi:hypothetical protein